MNAREIAETKMAEYRAAYQRANGESVSIRYERGWYYIGTPASKYRRATIEAYTAELNRRANLQEQPE